jgi:hypothetical protein
MLTTAEASRRFVDAGVSATPMTVLRWFNEGKLRGTQRGYRSPVKIEMQSVYELIAKARRIG